MSELDPKALFIAAKAGHHAQFEDKEQADLEWATWRDARPYAIQIATAIITAYLGSAPPSTELIAAREALKFYAEPTNYKGELVQGGTEDGVHTLTHHINLVRKDGGQRARRALSGNRSAEP